MRNQQELAMPSLQEEMHRALEQEMQYLRVAMPQELVSEMLSLQVATQ
jgi:hypothetical protein